MKRLFFTMLLFAAVGTATAQEPVRTLAEAQIEYDRAVAEHKRAVSEVRSEERRIEEAAERRVEEAKAEVSAMRKPEWRYSVRRCL